jgi:quercetin dioxygenase-like cupin family protein
MSRKNKHVVISNKTAGLVSISLLAGFLISQGWAAVSAPTKHVGLKVEKLGAVPAKSVKSQVGLDGKILLLRRITIEPGGQIAKHSAATVPGVVYMESGAWVEGRDHGEIVHKAGDTFIEDADTVHWFFNRGDEPASAIVCDIKPAG